MIHRAARCALLIFLKREQPRIPVRDLLAPVVDHVREGRAGSVRACGPPHLLPAVQVLRATQPEDRRPVAGTRKSARHWQIAGPRFHFSCSSSAPSALAPRLGAVLLDLRACVHLQASLCHNCCASLASRSDARSSRCSRRLERSRVVLGQGIVSSYTAQSAARCAHHVLDFDPFTAGLRHVQSQQRRSAHRHARQTGGRGADST